MRRTLLPRALTAVSLALALGGAGCSGDATDDGETSASGDALVDGRCNARDSAVFFHGLQGYGREIATDGLCVPSITNFSGSVSGIAAPGARVVGGYSAGRLPLLRRLAGGQGNESVAVMLDPSYSDGARFNGETGPSIVTRWLAEDPSRRFVFVYLPASAGWREYTALKSSAVASQIRTCPVRAPSHFDMPRAVGASLFLDPEAWVAERCVE